MESNHRVCHVAICRFCRDYIVIAVLMPDGCMLNPVVVAGSERSGKQDVPRKEISVKIGNLC